MSDFLNDPDGAGPNDGPIGDAIEDALSEINISGAIAGGLGVGLETPLFEVSEDTAGITIGTDSAFTASIGDGEFQCPAVAGAPDLPGSLDVDQPFPSFGATTPVSGEAYDLGLCISSSGFNQLLKAQIECGLLISSITEVDLTGTGTPTALNTAILATFIPALAAYPPSTPVRIDITPSLAPVVSGDGPDGELTQLLISQVLVDIVVLDGPTRFWF